MRRTERVSYGLRTAIPALGDWIGTLDRTDKHVGIYNDDGQATRMFSINWLSKQAAWSTDADNGRCIPATD